MSKKILFSVLILTITACSSFTNELKNVSADRIARPAFMVERYIPTENFKLYAWERMHERGAPATLYIGGDSVSQGHKNPKFSSLLNDEATPNIPVALQLASRDLSENLIFLARPCQYLSTKEKKTCPKDYMQSSRYSREIIDNYHDALDEIKARYDVSNFHLVGYNGGAQIAGFLTAERQDVFSFISVAGNLDHDFVSKTHETEKLDNSLNLKGIAPRIAHVPQHHFIGGADVLITPGVYHSFRQEMGPSSCVKYSLIQDADHTQGWVEKWPDLLKLKPACSGVKTQKEEPAPLPFEPYIPSRDAIPLKGR